MREDLFKRLKEIEGWKYEICYGSKGFNAVLKKEDSGLSMIRTGKSMDELAEWILEETNNEREA